MAHILIADDDELIAEVASFALIDAGHACGWVTSAEGALDLLEYKRPDILLLDQDMPGMTGLTLLRQLRSSPRFYDLPVIMFTAICGAQDETQAVYAGAQDFVRKPFDPSRLIGCVDRMLASRANRPRHTSLETYLAENSGRGRATPPQDRRII